MLMDPGPRTTTGSRSSGGTKLHNGSNSSTTRQRQHLQRSRNDENRAVMETLNYWKHEFAKNQESEALPLPNEYFFRIQKRNNGAGPLGVIVEGRVGGGTGSNQRKSTAANSGRKVSTITNSENLQQPPINHYLPQPQNLPPSAFMISANNDTTKYQQSFLKKLSPIQNSPQFHRHWQRPTRPPPIPQQQQQMVLEDGYATEVKLEHLQSPPRRHPMELRHHRQQQLQQQQLNYSHHKPHYGNVGGLKDVGMISTTMYNNSGCDENSRRFQPQKQQHSEGHKRQESQATAKSCDEDEELIFAIEI